MTGIPFQPPNPILPPGSWQGFPKGPLRDLPEAMLTVVSTRQGEATARLSLFLSVIWRIRVGRKRYSRSLPLGPPARILAGARRARTCSGVSPVHDLEGAEEGSRRAREARNRAGRDRPGRGSGVIAAGRINSISRRSGCRDRPGAINLKRFRYDAVRERNSDASGRVQGRERDRPWRDGRRLQGDGQSSRTGLLPSRRFRRASPGTPSGWHASIVKGRRWLL